MNRTTEKQQSFFNRNKVVIRKANLIDVLASHFERSPRMVRKVLKGEANNYAMINHAQKLIISYQKML